MPDAHLVACCVGYSVRDCLLRLIKLALLAFNEQNKYNLTSFLICERVDHAQSFLNGLLIWGMHRWQ